MLQPDRSPCSSSTSSEILVDSRSKSSSQGGISSSPAPSAARATTTPRMPSPTCCWCWCWCWRWLAHPWRSRPLRCDTRATDGTLELAAIATMARGGRCVNRAAAFGADADGGVSRAARMMPTACGRPAWPPEPAGAALARCRFMVEDVMLINRADGGSGAAAAAN
eukprot:352478-Chlamydomonas_euryale.AAC.4